MRKKLQVFISSTYTDLIDERQAAVEAVLEDGHIPAGMELFAADNKSQWEIIRKWIDDSDVYLLILGVRYGSLEPVSRKSYTQLEYEYAVQNDKPLFAVFLSDKALAEKNHIEENYEKYMEFRKLVLSKICKQIDDRKDIKTAIFQTMKKFEKDYEFDGWLSGREMKESLQKKVRVKNQVIEDNPETLFIENYQGRQAVNHTIELKRETDEYKEMFLNLGDQSGSFRMRNHPHGFCEFIIHLDQYSKYLDLKIPEDFLDEQGLLGNEVIVQATTYDFKENGTDNIIIAVNRAGYDGFFWVFSYTKLDDVRNYNPYLIKLARSFQSKIWIDNNNIIIPIGSQGSCNHYSWFKNNFYEELEPIEVIF